MAASGWGHFVSKYSCCDPYPVQNPMQFTHAHGLGLTGDTAATGHDPTGCYELLQMQCIEEQGAEHA